MLVPAATALPAKEGKNIYKEDKKGEKGTKNILCIPTPILTQEVILNAVRAWDPRTDNCTDTKANNILALTSIKKSPYSQ
jgi:hypothetical protein